MDERKMMNGKTIEENVPEFTHGVIEYCAELKGLKALLVNLYQEMENGNRLIEPEQALSETLDSVYFIANAIGRISEELTKSTQLVGF